MGLLSSTRVNNKVDVSVKNSVNIKNVQPPSEVVVKMIKDASNDAEKRVVDVFKIETSWVNINCVIFHNEYLKTANVKPSLKYLFKFNVNNTEKTLKFDLDAFEVEKLKGNYKTKEVVEIILKKVSEYISFEMLRDLKLIELGID